MVDQPLYAVAGANGFVGYRLVEWLTLFGVAHVRPLVRTYAGLARLARFDLDARVVDATDGDALAAQLDGCDVLFHCVVGDRDTILRSVEAAYRACVKAQVRRLVYLSSAVVHGNTPDPGTVEGVELHDLQPFEYNVSKVLAERRLRDLCLDALVEVVTLRPCIVYGPRSKWWTAQIAEDLWHNRAYLLDGGGGICNCVYIDNLVEALYLAANAGPDAIYQEYFITDGVRVTWWDLYNSVAEALGLGLERVHIIESAPLARAAAACEAAQINAVVPVAVREKWAAEIERWSRPRTMYRRLTRAVREVSPFTARTSVPVFQPALPAGLPSLEWETASLQLCQIVLPIDKARRELGYAPHCTFAEGSRLTGEWLRFAYGLA